MARKNSTNLSMTVNADGFTIDGGTTKRAMTVTGADVTFNGSGSATITFPSADGTLATLTLEENTPLQLDPVLSADGKFSGITETGTAGAALAFGDLCYFQASDSRWELADADAEATAGPVRLGVCVLAAAGDGSATEMLMFGKIRADTAFPTLTIGAPAYVSTTAGDIQVAQPSGTDDVIRIVGHAVTADTLFFNPDGHYITHT